MPVVILSGSDYEMGCQYGQQAGQSIEMRKNAMWAEAFQDLKLSRDEVFHELKAYEYYIKEYTPEAIEMMKGMAAGATAAGYDVSYTDALMLNCMLRTLGPARRGPVGPYPSGAEDIVLPDEGCSHWAAWGSTTTNGKLICGDSADAIFDYQVAIIAFPHDGNNYMTVVNTGQLARHFSMNNNGLFTGSSGGFARRDIDFYYGVPRNLAGLHQIRFANSAAEAKDMILPMPVAWSWNLSLVDVRGNAFVVEITSAQKSVRESGDFGETDFIYATNNFFTEQMKEAMFGGESIEHGGFQESSPVTPVSWAMCSIPRNLELWTMFTKYHGRVDLDFAKMMWRFAGNPPPYHKPTDYAIWKETYFGSSGKGWDQKICNLGSLRVAIALPDDGDKGIAYLCTGPAGRVAYPLRPDLDHYQIAGTHAFYNLALASSPAEIVSIANNEAEEYIGEAYSKLMWLNYTDAGYAALDELYSLANTEYYEGVNWKTKATLAKGDEALFYFARAATAFTRSQAHAKQVHNALVPPAACPEDLGLQPYHSYY